MSHLNDNEIAAALVSNQELMDKCMQAMSTDITHSGMTKPLREFSETEQYLFLTKGLLQLQTLQADHEERRKLTIDRYNTRIQKGEDHTISSLQRDTALATLDNDLKLKMIEGQLHWDEELFTCMKYLIAKQAANVKVRIGPQEGDHNLRVKLINCPLDRITPKERALIIALLSRFDGGIKVDNIILSKRNNALHVTFLTPEGKDQCLQAGVIQQLGRPTAGPATPYADRAAKFTIYLDGLAPATTEEQIRAAFNANGSAPISVKVNGVSAFAGYDEEEMFFFGLSLCRLKIAGNTIDLVAGKFNDPDGLKAIVGFWNKSTTPPEEMYQVAGNAGWNVLTLQQTFWDNGSRKHYYFAKFRSLKDKVHAMFNPVVINDDIIQVFEIRRDEAGRLIMPREGEWRKRAREENQQRDEEAWENRELAPLALRTFDF